MPGAAVLVGRAALRAGAGLVTIACQSSEMIPSLTAALPEATYLLLDAEGLGPHLAQRSDDVIVCGPGLGQKAAVRSLVQELLEVYEGSLVLDADALNVIGEEPEVLARAHAEVTPRLRLAGAKGVEDGALEQLPQLLHMSVGFSH